MIRFVGTLSCILGLAVACLGSSISGQMTWIKGFLESDVTAKTTAQTVKLAVGVTTKTITNVFVIGPPGTVIPSGSEFEVLAAGSQPFAGTYSTTVLSAFTVDIFFDGTASRSVPITQSGALSGSIGFSTNSPQLHLFLPPFTLGNLNFNNGLDLDINVELAAFSLSIPSSTSTPTLGKVVFPVASLPLCSFTFSASGTGSLDFSGSSTGRSCYVAGALGGTGTVMSRASLTIFGS